jgi:hypothetical protein
MELALAVSTMDIGLYVHPGKPEVRKGSTQEQDWSTPLRIVNEGGDVHMLT